MPRDLTALADTVLEAVKAYCASEFERRAAVLPAPRDGVDGKSVDQAEVAQTIKTLLDAAVKSLPAAEKGERGEPGDRGADGASIDPAAVDALVKQHVAAAVSALPPPEKGADGEKGEPGSRGEDAPPVDRAELTELVKLHVAEAVASLPPPEKGGRGEKGEPGSRGEDAPPVDRAELTELVKLHVAEAVASLPPPEKGGRGEKGEPGDRGDKGEDGISVPGTPGDPGRDGRDGKAGPPGRDALQIDPIEGIDETRSYARGTYASHKGGLWRAVDDTDGMKGWHCIVAGFAAPEIDLAEDGRTVVVRAMRSTGAVVEKSFKLPVQIYRGVYREGDVYERGDTATWAGSLWHANEPTSDKPGDGSKAWSLAVKRGRDGKDGDKGDPGPSGKPAR